MRVHRLRLAQHLPTLHAITVDAAQEDAHVVARFTAVQQFAEHLDARAGGFLRVANAHDSTSSPTLITPRSIRPVTTVPRPEIENTSSIGIRNGWSTARAGVGI